MRTHEQAATLATIGLTLLLCACGGGGGGGGGTPPPSTTNIPPEIGGTSANYVRSGDTYSFTPDATDADGNALTFNITNKPYWAQFDMGTGELSGVPDDQAVGHYADIAITVTDGKTSTALPPFSLDVLYGEVKESNVTFSPGTLVTPTADGYSVVGEATITVGSLATDLKNADLQFEYDANGNLLDLAGVADLPPVITDNLSVDSSVQVAVGLYTGAEINARADIGPDSEPGIRLRDEFRYLVYFLSTAVDLTYHGDDGVDEPISLGLAGSQTLIISDPTDPMFYYFGDVGGAGIGLGRSAHAQIPYEPLFKPTGSHAFAALEPFYGTNVAKGIFPVSAFKVLDVLQLQGLGVCRPPSVLVSCEISWSNAIESSLALLQQAAQGQSIDPSQQIKIGMNGTAALKFAVLGIDLFEYHLLDMAATFDVGTTREHMALQGVIDPAKSVQPDWIPIQPIPDPNSQLVGNVFADFDPNTATGDFGIELAGDIQSAFPPAKLSGSVAIDTNGLTMTGHIGDATNPITVTATMDGSTFDASIHYGYDFSGNIDALVTDALDRELGRLQSAYDSLQQATADYELEVSLHGLRAALPTIAAQAINILDAVPDAVASAAKAGVVNYVNNYQVCVDFGPLGKSCSNPLDPLVDQNAIGDSVASTARTDATNAIAPIKAAMQNLSTQAQAGDDASLREALRLALQTAYDNRIFSHHFHYTYSFPLVGTVTVYDATVTRTVIPAATADQIKTAADNVYRIQETSDLKIQAQQIYDGIPTDTVINQAKQDVAAGLAQIPTFNGAGYTLTRSYNQSAYILLGNERIEIQFNPLDPVAAIEGVADAIATALTGG